MKTLSMAIAMALTFAVGVSSAAQPGVSARQASHVAKTERGRLAGQIVRSWAGYVQKVYGTPPMTWANAMGSTFAQADIGNMRRAAKLKTYEAMTSALLGQRMTDAQAIDRLARSDGSKSAVMALGSPAGDLVYTMITPCRIVDTRVAGGKLSAGATRNFIANSPGSNFAVQGGSASTDCGIPAEPSAVAMEVTVVATGGNGYLTLFPYGVTRPLAASMNYTGANQTLGNEVIVKQTIGGAADFSLYSLNSAHVVVDAVGYFMAPVATALDCARTATNTVAVAASSNGYAAAPACAAGYTETTTQCRGGFYTDTIVGQEDGSCFMRAGTSASNLNASRICCRVPGR